MTTYSRIQIEHTTEALNAMFEKRGSTARVFAQGRSGHTGLDLMNEAGAIQKTLTVGTKSEVWDYMHAMMEALWLLEPPYRA